MKNKGFSLIELLLVIAVILIISTGSYVGFQQFSKNQILNTAADTLRNSLNEAKSNAMSQVITQCNQNETLVGHSVVFNPSVPTSTYDLQEVCRNINPPNTTTNRQVKRITLSSGVTFSGSPAPIEFLVLTGGINGGVDRTIRIMSGSQPRDITVTAVGVIK